MYIYIYICVCVFVFMYTEYADCICNGQLCLVICSTSTCTSLRATGQTLAHSTSGNRRSRRKQIIRRRSRRVYTYISRRLKLFLVSFTRPSPNRYTRCAALVPFNSVYSGRPPSRLPPITRRFEAPLSPFSELLSFQRPPGRHPLKSHRFCIL